MRDINDYVIFSRLQEVIDTLETKPCNMLEFCLASMGVREAQDIWKLNEIQKIVLSSEKTRQEMDEEIELITDLREVASSIMISGEKREDLITSKDVITLLTRLRDEPINSGVTNRFGDAILPSDWKVKAGLTVAPAKSLTNIIGYNESGRLQRDAENSLIELNSNEIMSIMTFSSLDEVVQEVSKNESKLVRKKLTKLQLYTHITEPLVVCLLNEEYTGSAVTIKINGKEITIDLKPLDASLPLFKNESKEMQAMSFELLTRLADLSAMVGMKKIPNKLTGIQTKVIVL